MAVTAEITGNALKVIDTAKGTLYALMLTDSRTVTEYVAHSLSVADGVSDQAINFGGVAAAKVFFLQADQAITVKVNGSTTALPVNPQFGPLVDESGGYTAATISNASGSAATVDVLIAG